MFELLTYLWPDFSSLLIVDNPKNSNGLSAWFWILTALIFVISTGCVCRHLWHFSRRIKALNSLLEYQTPESLAINRRTVQQRALTLRPKEVGKLWQAFDESLVSSGDNEALFKTVDAEHFFNAHTLAPGITGSRLLAAAPGFLVAIGVLGTFVGLTVGLVGLQLGEQADVNQLKAGIHNLIAGAAVAFMTSVWGVTFSLLLNFGEKLSESRTLKKINRLQQTIDQLYPMIPAEQSLLRIAEHSRDSKESLQELHERIGERLQESISGMSEGMQQAITDALNNIMAPAINSLVNTTSQQSSNALQTLVGQFMQGMTSAGRQQSELMQQAAAEVNTAVAGMSEHINQLACTLGEQQKQQVASTEQQRQLFETQFEQMARSADEQQQRMEQRFSELMNTLSNQFKAQLDTAQHHDKARQNIQAELMNKFIHSSQHQIQAMDKASDARLNALESVFSNLTKSLTTQLSAQIDAAEQREKERASHHHAQQSAALDQQKQLLNSLGQTSQQQISALTDASAKQQRHLENTVNTLLTTLNEQMGSHGQQAEVREQKRQQRMNEQLDAMATQQQQLISEIANAVQSTQQQSLQMADQHQKLMASLMQASSAAADSSKHMNSSANQLGMLAVNVQKAADVLGQRLEQVTQRIEDAGRQNATLAAHLQQQTNTLAQLQKALLESAQHFEQTAHAAHNGFGEMKRHQQAFLAGVRDEFSALGETLRQQVENVEKQAEEWLHSYAEEVHYQVDERMNQWNRTTLAFANQMKNTVNAISNIVDELEVRNDALA